MTDLDETLEPTDGRVARRQRNVDAVLDVVLEMFGEDAMFPTIEQAATRSGLSLRSLYRYFADPGELLEATIKRTGEVGLEHSRLHAIGEGPLADRIEDFAESRVGLYEAMGPVFRATMANAARLPRISDQMAANRDSLRAQFELQFESELLAMTPAARESALSAGDLLTQLASLDYLRRHRQLSPAETHAVIKDSLTRLLS